MNVLRWTSLVALAALAGLAVLTGTAGALPSSVDWSQVEQALGKPGRMMPGDVYRIGMPRSDLSVSVEGVPVKAGFALGSYAAFKQMGPTRGARW